MTAQKICIILALGISACGTPLKSFNGPSDLESRYQKLWDKSEQHGAKFRSNRTLIQLGMPEPDAVRIWYYDSSAKSSTLALEIGTSKTPARGLSASEYELLYDETLRTGIVRIPHLEPATTYQVTIKIGEHLERLDVTTAPSLEASETFSVLAWSCNEPFTSARDGVLARDVLSWRNYSARAQGTLGVGRDPLMPVRPSFSLGLGDQIYVDSDASKDEDGTNLSFFSGDRSGKETKNRRFVLSHALEYLSLVYRFTFGLPPTNQGLRALPTIMMWDDHEIRDGWGSQGDETSAEWQDYFRRAQRAFVGFSGLRNPNAGGQKWGAQDMQALAQQRGLGRAMDTQFQWGQDVSFFVTDLRSHRDKTRVISKDQKTRLERWFRDIAREHRGKPHTLVLGSSVPVFALHNNLGNFGACVVSELRDDLRDKWSHKDHKAQYQWLLSTLHQHFSDNPKHQLVILSGDIHQSGLFYLELGATQGAEKRVFGYEIVSSGIAHGIDSSIERSLVKRTSKFGSKTQSILVSPRGSIGTSPAFAELVFAKKREGGHRLSVMFYPVSGLFGFKNRLVNDFSLLSAPRSAVQPYAYFYRQNSGAQDRRKDILGALVPLEPTVPKVPETKKWAKNRIQYMSTGCTVSKKKGVSSSLLDSKAWLTYSWKHPVNPSKFECK